MHASRRRASRSVGHTLAPGVTRSGARPAALGRALARRFSHAAQTGAAAAGIHLAPRRGFALVRRDYDSPLPEPHELADGLWSTPSRLAGLRFDIESQLGFAQAELSAAIREFDPPLDPTGRPGEYHAYNGTYDSVDGEIAYAMVRRFTPARVIELGSGNSTLALAAACRANARDGKAVAYAVYDPHPRGNVPIDLEGVSSTERLRAQDVPLERLTSLQAGDILFVDTTHVAKLGGDVNYLVLDVLPSLADGVLVHFHDVFLPWHYHRAWVERGVAWNEQYLLQAFLAFNERYDVLFASHAVALAHPGRLEALVPSYRRRSQPSACWLRRRSGRGDAGH